MNPSTLYDMLTGDLYYGKRNSKAEDGVQGIKGKNRGDLKKNSLE